MQRTPGSEEWYQISQSDQIDVYDAFVKCNNDTNVCNFKNKMDAHFPASVEVTGSCSGAGKMPVNLIWLSY